MDGGDSPRFLRQASCSCAPSMSRGYVRGGFDLADDDEYDDDFRGLPFGSGAAYGKVERCYAAAASDVGPYAGGKHGRPAAAAPRGCGTVLRGLWRRIVREKKRMLLCTTGCVPLGPSAAAAREPYDAFSYAQNFDDGEAWVEPENLSRSFSARFAVPSRVLQRVAV